MPPHAQRVGVLRRFGLKTGIDFDHFDMEKGMELLVGVYERIYLSVPNEEKEKFANSK